MATLKNRVFQPSPSAEQIADCYDGYLSMLNVVCEQPIDRVLFVRLTGVAKENFDITKQARVLARSLESTFALDVVKTLLFIKCRKDRATFKSFLKFAKKSTARLVGRRYVPRFVQAAMKTIDFCDRGLDHIPGCEEKQEVFSLLQDCLCRFVPIGRCSDGSYLVYVL